jgi:hypothetical protein
MAILGLRDILFLCFCGAIHFAYRYRQKRLLPLPPSLPGWPLIGNAFQLPLTHVHLFYQDLERKLGLLLCSPLPQNALTPISGSKIMYVEAFGQPIIVINDVRIASDLLEKRSALYSSRYAIVFLYCPSSPYPFHLLALANLCFLKCTSPTFSVHSPWWNTFPRIRTDQFFGMLPYGNAWRNQRRLFHQHFPEKNLCHEEKALEFVRKALLPNLYQTPEDFLEHLSG